MRAMVLSGGGSRGAYQIGVWQALLQLGINFDIITGTSIGALNGTLMAQGDFNKALEIWHHLKTDDIIASDFWDSDTEQDEHSITKVYLKEILRHNGCDVSPLKTIILSLLDEDTLRASGKILAIVAVEYPSFKPLEITLNDMPKGTVHHYLMASSACRPAFKTYTINDKRYIDGCFYDNLPVNLALKLGADEIIAVDLHAFGLKRVPKTNVPMLTIDSYWPLGSTLYFSPEITKRNITLGYHDTLKTFGLLDGIGYTFYPTEPKEIDQLYRRLMLILYRLAAQGTVSAKGFFRHPLAQRLTNSPMERRRKIVYLFAEAAAQRLALAETPCYTLNQLHYQLLNTFAAGLEAPLKSDSRPLAVCYWQIAQSLHHDKPIPLKNQHVNDIMTAIYLNIL